MDIMTVTGLVGLGILLLFISVFIIRSIRESKRNPEICPHCGEVIRYKRQESVWDENCLICHGTGQGNGGYTGDSGECTCGYYIQVCPHCGVSYE